MAAVNDDCPLTPREYQALVGIAQGKTPGQIAYETGRSVTTVRTQLSTLYKRLGVPGVGQAIALMLREGWATPDDLLTSYTGNPYSTAAPRSVRTCNWVPSPAQRLYLDAFDMLLKRRDAAAARRVSFYFAAMCVERGCPDRREGGQDVDRMLLGMARALLRPIAVAA